MQTGLGNNLTYLMDKNRINSVDLARKTGIPMSTLKKIRTHVNTNPTLSTLIPIADYFSVSLDQLVNGDVTKPNRLVSSLLPVRPWQMLLQPYANHYVTQFILSELKLSDAAFATRVSGAEFKPFPLHTLLLVEPNQEMVHRDYVVAYSKKQESVTIKQYIIEDEMVWLGSVNIAENIIALTEDMQLLGVIVEARTAFSTVETHMKNHQLKLRESIL